jgi:hypothetical protein
MDGSFLFLSTIILRFWGSWQWMKDKFIFLKCYFKFNHKQNLVILTIRTLSSKQVFTTAHRVFSKMWSSVINFLVWSCDTSKIVALFVAWRFLCNRDWEPGLWSHFCSRAWSNQIRGQILKPTF